MWIGFWSGKKYVRNFFSLTPLITPLSKGEQREVVLKEKPNVDKKESISWASLRWLVQRLCCNVSSNIHPRHDLPWVEERVWSCRRFGEWWWRPRWRIWGISPWRWWAPKRPPFCCHGRRPRRDQDRPTWDLRAPIWSVSQRKNDILMTWGNM